MRAFLWYDDHDDSDFADALSAHLVELGHEVSTPLASVDATHEDRIDTAVRAADVAVFLLTGVRSDSSYAVGLAVGMRKSVLLVARDPEMLATIARGLPYYQRSDDRRTDLHEVGRRVFELSSKAKAPTARRPATQLTLDEVVSDPSILEGQPSAAFERAVIAHLSRFAQVTEAPGQRDSGYDAEIHAGKARTLVQIKAYRTQRLCSVTTVRELIGAVAEQGAKNAILVTSSDFTAAARELAYRSGILPLTPREVLEAAPDLPGALAAIRSRTTHVSATRVGAPQSGTRASQLLVDVGTLRSTSHQVRATIDLVRNALLALENGTAPEALWQGSTSAAYTGLYERWTRASRELVDALESVVGLMTRLADAYEQADSDVANLILGP